MRVYLDTNLWNAALDQAADPIDLVEDLDRNASSLVLGLHAFYELVRTCYSGRLTALMRGQALFSCLLGFFNAGMRCVVKDTSECLVAEMYSLKGVEGSSKYLTYEDVCKIQGEAEALSRGQFKSEWGQHVRLQTSASKSVREELRLKLTTDTRLANRFRATKPEQLRDWVGSEAKLPIGKSILTGHLGRHFPDIPTEELAEYSDALLADERHRVAHALVRAELYYHWRCAHRGSNPYDLLDDMYHVMNSAYCDAYATAEPKQREYAEVLLPSGPAFLHYDQKENLAEWLKSKSRHKWSAGCDISRFRDVGLPPPT